MLEEVIYVAIIPRKQLFLESPRSVFKVSVPVGNAPHPGEQQTGERIALGQQLVLKESDLDVARPCHD